MIKKQLYRAAAATVLGLSLATGGMVAADNNGSISKTGTDSDNTVTSTTHSTWKVDNDTDLSVHNDNDQHAYTGDAKASHNTTAGDATSGDAMNTNSLSVKATVNNAASTSGMGGSGSMDATGSIDNTGTDSTNTVTSTQTSKVTIDNDTNIRVYNDNDQRASTGDASVRDNTTGGSATSGDATNTNSSSFTFDVSN